MAVTSLLIFIPNPRVVESWWTPGGVLKLFFERVRGVRPEVWNPYPYLRIFLPQKTADLKLFFEIFRKSGPISKGFSNSKWLILQFFRDFCEMGPSSKDFFDQNGTHV